MKLERKTYKNYKSKGEWKKIAETAQKHMKEKGITIEEIRGWLKEIREELNKK